MKQFLKLAILTICSLVFCAGISFAQSAAQPFKIMGKITGNSQIGKVIATYDPDKKHIEATVINGEYTLSGTIDEPTIFHLQGVGKVGNTNFDENANKYDLYLAPGNVLLQSDKTLSSTQATGNGAKWNKDYQYMAKQVVLTDDLNYNAYYEADSLNTVLELYLGGKSAHAYSLNEYRRDSIKYEKARYLAGGSLDSILNQRVLIPYVKKHPDSPLAIWVLYNIGGLTKEFKYDLQYPLFQQLAPQIKALYSAKIFKEGLAISGVTEIGKIPPAIILPDTSGHNLSLASLQGKYVLIDFWADWCAPCRAEFPYMAKAYEKYKEKGFTIFGVSGSFSTNKTRWKRAIVDEKSNWLHVYDENSVISKQYGIKSIPQNFLIDPKGVIIALNLRGDDLEKKLKNLLEK